MILNYSGVDKGLLKEMIATGLKSTLLESWWEFEKGTPFSRQMQVYTRIHSWQVEPTQTSVPLVPPWAGHSCWVNNLHVWAQQP